MQPWPPNQECNWEHYSEFKSKLTAACYRFAAESGSEWGSDSGYQCVEDAARLAAAHQVPFWAMRRMVEDTKLVSFETFMERLLAILYKA